MENYNYIDTNAKQEIGLNKSFCIHTHIHFQGRSL